MLDLCMRSVSQQSYPGCLHYMVADGHPSDAVEQATRSHIRLAESHGDNGNLARCIGALTAVAEGADAVFFLDADNWFAAEHVQSLISLGKRTGAAVCTSGRAIYAQDGSLLCADDAENDGVRFADTSSMCFFRAAFGLIPVWVQMGVRFGPICDRVMWRAVADRALKHAHAAAATLSFRSHYAWHYRMAGVAAPPGVKNGDNVFELLREFEHEAASGTAWYL
jgi:hypothetical protein